MKSPKAGFVGIANEIWDEVIRRDFTKRQKDILLFIWRLSYGCRRDVAVIPMLKDFTLCGVGKGHIGAELKTLEHCKVITRNGTEYRFNEEYGLWQITSVRGWDSERFNELIHLNLIGAKKSPQKVTETGTLLLNHSSGESYQNGNFEQEEELPKRELDDTDKVTETGTLLPHHPAGGSYQNGNFEQEEELPKRELDNTDKVTETGTDDEKQLLKQEPSVTETVTGTPIKALGDVAYRLSKDSIKDSKDKYIVEIVTYLNEKAGKHFSPKTRNTIKLIRARLGEGRTRDDFTYVIDVKVAEWLGTPQEKYLRPETLFTETHFEAYRNQPFSANEVSTKSGSRLKNNKTLLQKRMGEIEHEQQRSHAHPLFDVRSLPDGGVKRGIHNTLGNDAERG